MWALIGTACVLWGAKRIGDKKRGGWLWFMLGDILWIVAGYKLGSWEVMGCEALFLILHARGFMKWKPDEKK